MELSIENLARAAFPRTAAAQGAKMPRRLLSGIMDAASFPGRTLMAAADATGPTMTLGDIIANQSIPANSTDFLSSMGRTGAMPGRSRVDAISESIIRDPISVLGLGTGSLAKAVGGKVAAATGNKVAPKLASYVADLLANSGTDAASQYATTGVIDPRQMALGAGLGLGMQGLGAGVMKMAPKVTQNPNFRKWFGDSKVVDEAGNPLVVYHGTKSRGGFDAFDPEKIGTATDEGFLGRGFYFTTSEPTADAIGGITKGQKTQLSPAWAGSTYGEGGSSGAFHVSAKNPVVIKPEGWSWDKRHIVRDQLGLGRDASADDILEALQRNGNDAVILDYSGGGWPHQEVMIPSPTQIKSATGNRGTFDPTDPNITHLTGGGTQLPSLQLPGFAKRLGSRYMNDTTATSGRY